MEESLEWRSCSSCWSTLATNIAGLPSVAFRVEGDVVPVHEITSTPFRRRCRPFRLVETPGQDTVGFYRLRDHAIGRRAFDYLRTARARRPERHRPGLMRTCRRRTRHAGVGGPHGWWRRDRR